MDNDGKKTLKAAMFNTISNILALAVGLVVIPILSSVLPPDDLGIVSTFVSNRNIMTVIVSLAIYTYINQAMIEFPQEKVSYMFSCVLFGLISTVVFFIILFPFRTLLAPILSLDGILFYWLFISVLFQILYMLFNYYCTFWSKAKSLAGITIIAGPFAQILSLIIVKNMSENKFFGRILGLDIAFFVIGAVGLSLIWKNRPVKYEGLLIKKSLKTTVPLVPHLLAQVALTQCDLILVSYFTNKENTGIYSMGHTIGYLVYTLLLQVMAVWSPWVYRRIFEDKKDMVYKNASNIVLLGSYLSIGMMAVEYELVDIFLDDSYAKCAQVIPILVYAMFFQFMYSFYYDILYYYKKTRIIAFGSILAAVMNFVLNLLLIPRYGYIGACYTTVASYFLLFIFSYICAKKYEANKIYNNAFIFADIVAVTAFFIFAQWFAGNVWVRYGAMIAITVIIAISKRDLIFIAKDYLVDRKRNKNESK